MQFKYNKNLSRGFSAIFFLLLTILISSCATSTAYYKNINHLVSQEKYIDAVDLNEKSQVSEYGEKNTLGYYLDRGLLLHFINRYKDSNLAFEKAKKIAEEYFTKSITTEASTFLISDNMRPYYGEDFERALIHMFNALNYIFLGQESESLVEARQVDHFLKTLEVNYGHKNTYTEDAFIRYIMGMIYENQGQINDAFISYRQSLDAYSSYIKLYNVTIPQELVNDVLRTAQKLGFNDEIDEIKKKWNIPNNRLDNVNPDLGELIILDYNGFSPVKIDSFFEISVGKGWIYVENADIKGEDKAKKEQAGAILRSIASDDMVRIAFPKYAPEKYRIVTFIAKTSNSNSNGVLVEDIGNIAIKGLDDRIARIKAKAIARGMLKYLLAKKIEDVSKKSGNDLLTFIVSKTTKVISTITETADKRSWQSLPDKILMSRLVLPEGTHTVELIFKDSGGNIVTTKTLNDIQIKKGKKTFVAIRTAI